MRSGKEWPASWSISRPDGTIKKQERSNRVKEQEIKQAVKEQYSQIVEQSRQSCCSTNNCCCGTNPAAEAMLAGYTKEELAQIPQESVLGLGCGNPAACAGLRPGETVLDLGSGAGIDVFLAAIKVGAQGKAIGVDMTPQMVKKANALAREKGYDNVEFRLGEIESLPVADSSVDTIMSNCVINLSTDKSRVFREAYRVLKPGGRMVISDIVSEKPLPAAMQGDMNAWSSCISGALQKEDYLDKMSGAGFRTPEILSEREFYAEAGDGGEMHRLFSITVRADK
jgi:SAM-dependent methyltransferase